MSGDVRKGLVLRAVAVSVSLVVLTSGTFAYLASQRRAGDIGLARGAVEGLTFVDRAGIAMGPAVTYSNALEDNWAAIDLFLHSDSRYALPEAALAIERAWIASLVADQLWRMSDDGNVQPLVSDVYASGRMLKDLPGLEDVVVGAGAAATFDNTDMKAVKAVFEQARLQRQEAVGLLDDASAASR